MILNVTRYDRYTYRRFIRMKRSRVYIRVIICLTMYNTSDLILPWQKLCVESRVALDARRGLLNETAKTCNNANVRTGKSRESLLSSCSILRSSRYKPRRGNARHVALEIVSPSAQLSGNSIPNGISRLAICSDREDGTVDDGETIAII